MNILLIGGDGSLTNQLIRKMNKEGHRVHLFTGNRYKTADYEKVFEKYELSYDSECLGDVFESVNPDVTIFMGAFDSNFRWLNEQREMVRFTSSLTNFLTAYAMAGKGRFIYLSSDAVYSGDYGENIAENNISNPSNLKGMALAQGEDICESFRRLRDTDIVVLRLDHMYKIPKTLKEVDDIPSRMCLEAMKTKSIVINPDNKFSLLYEFDVVEFIFQLVKCDDHSHSLYNLSSSKEVTEAEIAQYVAQAMGEDADIAIVEASAESRRCILDNRRFYDEFGLEVFADTQKTVEEVVNYMVARPRIFLTEEQRKKTIFERIRDRMGWAVKAMIPYIENIICFIPFFLLNNGAADSRYFSELDFYLLYVLLFAVVHGQQQAIVSAVFAVVGYFITQVQARDLFSVALDYNIYIWIAQLFIIGLVVGYMKDQIHKLRMESEEERLFLNRQLSDIKDINGSNVRVKDALETQVVNNNDSIGKIYAITSKLEQYTPEEVLFHAAEMLEEFLGSKDIAIYTISNRDYARLFTFTSKRAKSLGKSIRYRELEELYDEIAEHKVYINKTQDERYPLMAAAVFDNDQMQIIIMAWGIPWERMTLGQANILTSISYLIQNAVVRASRYITTLENRRYQEDAHMMEEDVFTSLVRVFMDAKNKELTECSIIRLEVQDHYEETAKAVSSKLRQSDFIGILDDGNMYILLSNADSNDAGFVMDRIQNEGYGCTLLEDFRI